MPEKDKNTLFKRIIFRKYKDEINWVKMINYLFKERKIFEEDVEWQPFLGLFFGRHLFLIINWS